MIFCVDGIERKAKNTGLFHFQISTEEGPRCLNELGSRITKQLIQAYHQYGVGSRPLCKLQKGSTRHAVASDKVYQLLAHGRLFSPGTLASSTTKTGRHDIAEILLKVALNIKKSNQQMNRRKRQNRYI